MPTKTTKKPSYYDWWPTAWGPIAALATDKGIAMVILPHYAPKDLDELIRWDHPGIERTSDPFEEFAELSKQYFRGQRIDFADVKCDLPDPNSFSGQIYRLAREIAYGETVSYSEVARRAQRPDAARPVATAMSKNPTPLIVPCHRVTYASGQPGGFSAAGGVELKERMIGLEAGTAS